MIDYREIQFEEVIEHYVTTDGGHSKANPEFALDPTALFPFICESQPAKWKIIADLRQHRTNGLP